MKEEYPPKKSLKAQVMAGLVWRLLERISVQLISLVVSIVLARLLTPEEFGITALVTVFVNIATALAENGFGNALIQKETVEEIDYSSVFYFGVCTYSGLYLLLFLTAPYIALFYRDALLTPVIRVMGLRLIIAAFNMVQYAHVHRYLQFKKYFLSTLIGTITSAAAAFCMAYRGFGVWALVAQTLVSALVNMIVLWIVVGWRPKRCFSWISLKTLLSYGWKLMAASLINTVYHELRSLIIGRVYSTAALAYYTKGRSFPSLITNNVSSTIEGVLFPAMSRKQKSPNDLRTMTRRSIQVTTYFTMPLMIGLAVVARPLVLALLTEKWIACVPFLQIICITHALLPMLTANEQAIKALGRSGLHLKLQIIKKGIGVFLLLLSIPFGVLAVTVSGAVVSVISTVINAFPNSKLLGYGYFAQLADIAPSVLMSAVMAAAIYPMQYLPIASILVLILQVISGGAIYLLLSVILKNESFYYILHAVRQMRMSHSGENRPNEAAAKS